MPEETIEQQVERCVRERARRVVEDTHYPNAAHVLIRDSFQPLVLALAKANEDARLFIKAGRGGYSTDVITLLHRLEVAFALLKERI